MPSDKAGKISGTVIPTWDSKGRCWAIIEWESKKLGRTVLRCPEGDKDPDPADWWKRA